jgi:hypothetical protein
VLEFMKMFAFKLPAAALIGQMQLTIRVVINDITKKNTYFISIKKLNLRNYNTTNVTFESYIRIG